MSKVDTVHTLCVSRINSNLIVQKLHQTEVHKGNKESSVSKGDSMHTCNTNVYVRKYIIENKEKS